ncbi:alpha-tocopherol transfer protein-like [Hermetia illucens]|uniref:alpha-tocopherol transfer protein-like n=1 Tax=Hermetia illucens TaxID=343691 RepID=UPI0018CC767C|nr:alpha-tocopherol transfer protein-like [Hermetia illucens]XP_037915850.1 alpha-tocopherol transfer protein-like [Hermetia illucens]XP_037915851.1 alpha-tocopherol transfer protein-like [Hermetia illucens]XP_037915852.1 alpha-tocopherol transfer protein-like [Hermetia illucens]
MSLIEIRPLPQFLLEKAAKEINEVPKRIPDDLRVLRDWLKKEPHLISRTDDQFLVCFLRGCKHSLERSKEKLESYYTLRTAVPEFFTKRDPTDPEFIDLISKGLVCPLPIPHPKGSRIILCKPGVYDVNRHGFITCMKYSLMLIDRNFVEDDYFNICGYNIFLDMKGFTGKHIAQVTVPILKKVAELFKGAYPVRHKGIHFINFPVGLDALVALAKTFLPAKIANQIYFHSDIKSVYKFLPQSCLPAEYGGDAGTVAEITSNYMEMYLSDEKWFIQDAKYRTDESKRRGAPVTPSDLFGIDGSFRKLEID